MVPNTVRVIYIEPQDAQQWPDAKPRATEMLEDLQHFFADQMSRHDFGPRTFALCDDQEFFEYVKSTRISKTEFQANPWKACKQVLRGGRAPDAPDIEICFFDAYSVKEGVVHCPGVFHTHRRCYINALLLKTANRDWLNERGDYAGRVFPWISSEPMLETTLKWNIGQGLEFGDVAGSAYGIIAHELDRAFGGKHHASEDDERERKGHLMGLGPRGFRGYFRPDLTDDRCVLSRLDAESLNKCEFMEIRKLKPKGAHYFQR
jgi:hypothetical protein